MQRRLLWIVLAGCGGSSTDKSTPVDTDDDGTTTPEIDDTEEIVDDADGPYLGDEDGFDDPDLTDPNLVSGVELALAALPTITASTVINSYLEAMADQDADCPTWYVDESGAPYWYGSCATAAGAQYEGYGALVPYDGLYDGYNTWYGNQYYGTNSAVTADGKTWTSGGGAAFVTGPTDDGLDALYSAVEGDFSWEGPAADGSWLRTAASADLFWYVSRSPDVAGGSTSVVGTLTLGEGSVQTVIFDIQSIATGWGATCAEEPAGSLSILDAEGHWIDVMFDGSTWEDLDVDRALCDGCGTAWYKGAWIGDICFEFPPIADPDYWPWPT